MNLFKKKIETSCVFLNVKWKKKYRDQIFENVHKSKICFLTIIRCQSTERFSLKKRNSRMHSDECNKIKKNVNNHNVSHARKFIFFFNDYDVVERFAFVFDRDILQKNFVFCMTKIFCNNYSLIQTIFCYDFVMIKRNLSQIARIAR